MVWGVVYYSRWSGDSALKESYIPKWGDWGGGCWSDIGSQVANCLEQDLQDFLGFSGWRAFGCWMFGVFFLRWGKEQIAGGQQFGMHAFARCLKQDLQDFFWIFRMGEDLLTQVRSYERWTRDGERLREIMSVCECLCVWGGLSEAGFAGFIGIFRMGEDLLTQVRSYERWTRVCERCTREHERLRAFTSASRIVWSRICRISWDFRDDGAPLSQERSFERLTSVHERCTSASDRSSEGTGGTAGDFSVGLPTKAEQLGYFSEFFHNNVRYVRSKAYFEFDLGCFRSIFHVVDRFAQRGQAARLTLAGPRRARSFTKKTALPDAGRLTDVGWAGRNGLARHETRGPTSN